MLTQKPQAVFLASHQQLHLHTPGLHREAVDLPEELHTNMHGPPGAAQDICMSRELHI